MSDQGLAVSRVRRADRQVECAEEECSTRRTLPGWADGTEGTVHLRCVTTPDKPQKALLNRLALTLPLRLRRIDEVAQM